MVVCGNWLKWQKGKQNTKHDAKIDTDRYEGDAEECMLRSMSLYHKNDILLHNFHIPCDFQYE